MTYRKLSRPMGAALVLLVLAAPAQAQPRDVGVGHEIAEQGNIALRVIRAQVRVALQLRAPSLQGVATRREAAPALRLADGTGTTFSPTTTVRAAE